MTFTRGKSSYRRVERSPAGGEKLQGGASAAGGFPGAGDWRWFPSGQTSEFPNKRELSAKRTLRERGIAPKSLYDRHFRCW
ncbi:hypothetical protein NIES4073_11000 [Kalymmatonema gypsitolerans NIES-4073]|nr:hypothetical protein NIES4073_11000 [Scytonema sp. NIES-4073]